MMAVASLLVAAMAGHASAADPPAAPVLIGGSDEVRVIDASPISAATRVEARVRHVFPIESGRGSYEHDSHIVIGVICQL